MKILHVISDSNIGGAGVLLCNLLRHMDPERIESVVAIPRGSALGERIRALQIPVKELKHPCQRLSLSSVLEIERLLREGNFQGVHANAAISARIAGRRCGVSVVHTRHCCFPLEGIWKSFAIRRIGGMLNERLSDRVIATADAAVEDLIRLGVPRDRIEGILNGSDAVREVSHDELSAFREGFAIPREAFTVGICARLEPCKGHEVFLRAARILCDRMPQTPFLFLIAGDGSMKESLQRRAKEEGIAERVRFLGFLRDTAPFYRALRVNVNCSCGTETSCLAISEGMSAALPTVVSDYGGNAAMVDHGRAGFLFCVGEADSLADCIARIAEDRILEERMRGLALARYLEHYTAERMGSDVMKLYESLEKTTARG